MRVQLDLVPTDTNLHAVTLGISTENVTNSTAEPITIILTQSTESEDRAVHSGRRAVLQIIPRGSATEERVGDKSSNKSSSPVAGRSSVHKSPFWQRRENKRLSWLSRGSNILTSASQLVARVRPARLGIERSSGKDVAAEIPIGQNVLSHGVLSVRQQSLPVRDPAHHSGDSAPGPRGGDQPSYHIRHLNTQPFVGALGRTTTGATEQNLVQKRVKLYRGITLIVPSLHLRSDVQGFTATQDTGADSNVIVLGLLVSLGYEVDQKGRGLAIPLVDGFEATSLGTVQLKFWLSCDQKPRVAEFHVVKELPGHQALLSAELTMDLGHLVHSGCLCSGPRS